MSKTITYYENETRTIIICKKKLAKSDRMTLDISEHSDTGITHLFKY